MCLRAVWEPAARCQKKRPRRYGNELVRGLGMSECLWNSDPGKKAKKVGPGDWDERGRFCRANVVIFAGEAGGNRLGFEARDATAFTRADRQHRLFVAREIRVADRAAVRR